jgi:tetratricopeptide (TPR) repeat protein
MSAEGPSRQWLAEGQVLCKQQRYAEALDACEQAIRLNPRLPLAYRGKAGALWNLGDYWRAARAYGRYRSLLLEVRC